MVQLPRRPRALSLSRPELALLAITALWGATYLVIHLAMRYSGPMFFVGLRFAVAGLAAAVLFHRSMRGMSRTDLGAGAAIGVMIFFGYGLQTVGLQTISSSTSAFLTALFVPMVPFMQWAVFRKRPHIMAFAGAGLAFAGLVLLAGPGALQVGLGRGEVVTLVSTVAIAGEIILISLFAAKVHLGRVTVVQLLVCSILAFIAMPATGESVPAFSWVWLAAGVGLGLASCLIQLTMNWAQKSVDPTRATIIYTGEPVWAGVIGRIAGDRLPPLALLGAGLIVVSVLVSELKPHGRPPKGNPSTAVDLSMARPAEPVDADPAGDGDGAGACR
ncbi:drug/metabolite transporter (DMT)-like permease [Arthrobacter stackebrandtii]|uniref:Drug/metabolite transporter (DMT)-like permease n=1 Tax=Arthrobacter stackebrandtii TaxID=272161 RepID=A0ABS4Z0H4_9MICC|nr:DMT family transporter [Arthrobacter stackebrandtii]MBP2414501.1 drug/metabolite transporter (DMT)-like permease [Arthrobacter stackebrandtii]PYH01621.1 EamA family transporter [Arthrobacter stackebrandtii]